MIKLLSLLKSLKGLKGPTVVIMTALTLAVITIIYGEQSVSEAIELLYSFGIITIPT